MGGWASSVVVQSLIRCDCFAGDAFELLLRLFPITQMSTHQTLPEPPVVGNAEVEQFMDDHVVPKGTVEVEQVDAEVEMTIGGAGGPLVSHWAHADPHHIHIKLLSPFVHS